MYFCQKKKKKENGAQRQPESGIAAHEVSMETHKETAPEKVVALLPVWAKLSRIDPLKP